MNYQSQYQVELSHSAKEIGSGGLIVLSTPMLIAYIENTAFKYCEALMESGFTTVGTEINTQHLAPSKINDTITVTIKDIQQENRHFDFIIEAHDTEKLIAKATHHRVIVEISRFMEKI